MTCLKAQQQQQRKATYWLGSCRGGWKMCLDRLKTLWFRWVCGFGVGFFCFSLFCSCFFFFCFVFCPSLPFAMHSSLVLCACLLLGGAFPCSLSPAAIFFVHATCCPNQSPAPKRQVLAQCSWNHTVSLSEQLELLGSTSKRENFVV